MSAYLLMPLIQSAFCVGLSVLVIRRGLEAISRRIFLCFLISLVTWGIIIFGMRSSPDTVTALKWEKWLGPIGMITVVTMYHFSVIFTAQRTRRVILIGLYLLCAVLFFLIPTDLLYREMQVKAYGYAPVLGPVMFAVITFTYILVILVIMNLIRYARRTDDLQQRNRSFYILTGIIVLLNRFWPLHGRNVEYFLGKENCRFNNSRAFTVTFAVGGAGAQKEIGLQIARSLREEIASGKVLLNLIAGIREDVHTFFTEVKQELLPNCNNLRIVYSPDKTDYFNLFSDVIRVTDVLWTKPSELSFYCGLGIPIIIAPPIGAQELFNNKWLLEVQAGIPQEDPEYTKEWLFDFLRMGRLAESAWDGFLKARKYGTYKIFEILATGTMTREKSPLKR